MSHEIHSQPNSAAAEGAGFDRAIQQLVRTRRWIWMLRTVLVIAAVFWLLQTITIYRLWMPGSKHWTSDFAHLNLVPKFAESGFLLIAAIIVIGQLTRFDIRIQQYSQTCQLADLESVLEQQRKVWETLGIVSLTLFVLRVLNVTGVLASFG